MSGFVLSGHFLNEKSLFKVKVQTFQYYNSVKYDSANSEIYVCKWRMPSGEKKQGLTPFRFRLEFNDNGCA